MKSAAFLRAINVGGHIVKMDRLRALFESAGFRGAETFIASGNVVFESSRKSAGDLERAIETHLKKALGYPVATSCARCPSWPRSWTSNRSVQSRSSRPIRSSSDSCGAPSARTRVGRSRRCRTTSIRCWLMAVKSIGARAKGFAESTMSYGVFEKLLKTDATFRNLNTIRRMAAKYCGS
jgi:uncharacterized protein (DUF1697 family)